MRRYQREYNNGVSYEERDERQSKTSIRPCSFSRCGVLSRNGVWCGNHDDDRCRLEIADVISCVRRDFEFSVRQPTPYAPLTFSLAIPTCAVIISFYCYCFVFRNLSRKRARPPARVHHVSSSPSQRRRAYGQQRGVYDYIYVYYIALLLFLRTRSTVIMIIYYIIIFTRRSTGENGIK